MAGVNGVWPLACAFSARSQSSEKRGLVAVRARSSARSDTDANARPGGVISAFCEPVTTTSRPQASVSSGVAPSEEMASTTRQAERSRVSSAIACTSAVAPVDVSECTTNTAARSLRPFTRAATASGSGRLPHGERSTSTSARYASPIFTQRSPKLPADTTRILSPGESRFAKADSTAAVPLELNRITSRSVRYTRFRPVSTRASTTLNSGERWCGSGSASAATTAGGIGVGPGVSSRLVTRRAGPAAVPGRPSGRPSRRTTASPGP